jgi:2,4-diaminopentanoate dehydrogenase
MTRVIQWATGTTGTMALRHVIGRPDLDLVGVKVYDPAKAGVDAGALCGLPDTGLLATDDRDAVINAAADVVLYMGKVETDTPGCFADVCDLLASGKDVVATGSRMSRWPMRSKMPAAPEIRRSWVWACSPVSSASRCRQCCRD